jgi:WD repeat-containing protein 26
MTQLHEWNDSTSNFRVNDIAISPDGSRLVALLESRIAVFDLSTRAKIADHDFADGRMVCVNVSRDSRDVLVGINDNKIRRIALETGEVLREYTGHVQSEFIIKSAFGGPMETFVISGSERESSLLSFLFLFMA